MLTGLLLEVDRAIDNLVKSGKMFGMPNRRESLATQRPPGKRTHLPGATDMAAAFHNGTPLTHPDGRMGPNSGPRSHQGSDYGDSRAGHQSNLQNFYANQRHQSSRGSNEAEQMMQAKRRMAAQRERELRNYHQEQQYNRSRPPSSV